MFKISAIALALLACAGAGCSKGSEATSLEPGSGGSAHGEQPAAEGLGGLGLGGSAERVELSAEECAEAAGTVVGDIGDGAIHRPDYVCQSGHPPLGRIRPAPGGPIGVEGSVCCPRP